VGIVRFGSSLLSQDSANLAPLSHLIFSALYVRHQGRADRSSFGEKL
jgi:hypothetical protein